MAQIETFYSVNVDEQSIRIFGSYTPSINFIPGTKLQVVIKELMTKKNVGSNGETEFRHVVKKMYEGVDGIEIGTGKAGEKVEFDYTYTFNGSYRLPQDGTEANRINHATEHSVENFQNLHAVCFLEYPETKQVLQAAEADIAVGVYETSKIESLDISPNPTTDFLKLNFSLQEKLPISYKITDMSGKTIVVKELGTKNAGFHTETIDVSSLPAGMYDISISSGLIGQGTLFSVVR